jgi:glutathione peroxidase
MSLYKFEVIEENGQNRSLKDYQGKVLLIVNTATKCGLASQFEGLEKLYQHYKEQDFVILGFPSNQFKQEVTSAKEAAESCQLTYGVTFPMHELTTINGKQANPLFKYLTKKAPGSLGTSIKWNFTKFLVDRNGQVVKRFAPSTTPEKLSPMIEELL